MNRNYNRGRAYEYEIKKRYEKLGYTVFRTAGSHSPADLIAIRAHQRFLLNRRTVNLPDVVLIQCKTSKKPCSHLAGVQEFHQWARTLSCLGKFFVKGVDGERCYDSEVVYDAFGFR